MTTTYTFSITGPDAFATASSYDITSSWSNTSISSSYSPPQNITIVPSASWAPVPDTVQNSISSSYSLSSLNAIFANNSTNAQTANFATSANTSFISTNAINAQTASFILGSNSTTSSSASSSAPIVVGSGTTLFTGSVYQITSSWSNNSISASYSKTNVNSGTTLFTGSIYQITSSQTISASYAPTKSTTLFTGSIYQVTSSWSNNSTSASWAPNIGGGNVSNYASYLTLQTSSNNWVTISFSSPNQIVNLTSPKLYQFTYSNIPAVGQLADILLYISHSATSTSSLSFPNNWVNLTSIWPTFINSKTVSVLWLRAIDNNSIFGTYNTSGSNSTIVQSVGSSSISSSYSTTSLTSSYISQQNVKINNGDLYLLDNFGVWWKLNAFSGNNGVTLQLS